MFGLQRFQAPSPEAGAAWTAEQRWQLVEAKIIRHIAYAGIVIAACMIALAVAASNGQIAWAKAFSAGAVAGMGRVIFLIIKRHRSFIEIKMAGGMTRQEALREMNSRFG